MGCDPADKREHGDGAVNKAGLEVANRDSHGCGTSSFDRPSHRRHCWSTIVILKPETESPCPILPQTIRPLPLCCLRHQPQRWVRADSEGDRATGLKGNSIRKKYDWEPISDRGRSGSSTPAPLGVPWPFPLRSSNSLGPPYRPEDEPELSNRSRLNCSNATNCILVTLGGL